MKAVRCTEEGDTLVVEYQYTGTHTGPWPMPDGNQVPPTGRQTDFTGAAAYSMADGRITEHRDYSDRLTILMQLGLFPTT
jgi:predicted ester cyclase